jgi:GT2 family glycosyltransferase
MQPPTKRLCIVIINYKTPRLTLDCILSLREQVDAGKDCIVVVDNNSGGNDLALIRQGIENNGLESLVTLIPSPENKGFSAGNNIGIRAVEADFYLLANADTLFRPGAINALLQAAAEHPQAGLVSPRLEWPDEEPQVSCFRFHSPFSEIIGSAGTGIITLLLKRYDVPLPTVDRISWPEWTSFACVLIRREVFERIGLMDEGYFMYYEDVDFCRQARQAGFPVLNRPEAHVVHLRGQSSGVKELQQKKKRLPTYHYRSRSRYYRKFYGPAGPLYANLCWLSGRMVSKLRELLMGKARTVPEHQFFDIWTG